MPMYNLRCNNKKCKGVGVVEERFLHSSRLLKKQRCQVCNERLENISYLELGPGKAPGADTRWPITLEDIAETPMTFGNANDMRRALRERGFTTSALL